MAGKFHIAGVAEKGRLVYEDPDSLSVWLSMLDGKKIVGVFQKWYKTRTSQQNRAWWGIMIPVFMLCYGTDDKDEAHRVLLIAIGHCETKFDKKGRPHDEVLETHNLTTDEFSALWEKAARFIAMEYGVPVPDPIPELARI